ncbi:MAG: agmatine deiminase family protein [Saprospiraceae bacterium]
MTKSFNESRPRLPAEWEAQSAVQLTFPHEETDWADMLEEVLPCFITIAKTIARFQKVLVVCSSIEKVKKMLGFFKPENFIFAELPSNDTWARDHGGIGILEDGERVIVDFQFNGWGLKFPADKDNLITGRLFESGVFKASKKYGGLVLEGGSFESDGHGTLLTTAECLLSPNRNPQFSRTSLESYLKELFGLDRILWLENGFLAGDDTDSHIDTLARFCDPNTIAYVKCADTEDEHFTALQKMEQELKEFKTSEGNPYVLVPLPMPDPCFDESGMRLPATYANFLIINGAILVPVYGVSQDQVAMDIFKMIFPNREVIGIDCRPLIEQHGSLHCITMQYPADFL